MFFHTSKSLCRRIQQDVFTVFMNNSYVAKTKREKVFFSGLVLFYKGAQRLRRKAVTFGNLGSTSMNQSEQFICNLSKSMQHVHCQKNTNLL